MTLSVIVPVYKEPIRQAQSVAKIAQLNAVSQVIVVGTQIDDSVVEFFNVLNDGAFNTGASIECLKIQQPGRALQMNAGAAHATSKRLWFLHADSQIEQRHVDEMIAVDGVSSWGRFDLCFDDSALTYRVIALMINLRSKISSVATGDQGIFIDRDLFEQINGFAQIELMEDIDICKRLKKISPPHCLKSRLTTSARRWQKNGVFKTILLMWALRFGFFMGVSPEQLARYYRQVR